jgi:hypothetical protein
MNKYFYSALFMEEKKLSAPTITFSIIDARETTFIMA